MITETRKLTLSQKGSVLAYKWSKENTEPQAVVILVHGMAEHIARYQGFSEKLTENNFLVYGYNQRGHKDSITSKDDYGYMSDKDNFMILVYDLLEITEMVREEHPDLPIFIFGHSMGSFVTQRFVQLYGSKIDGIILCGSAKQPNGVLKMGTLLARMIIGLRGRRHRSKLLDKLTFGTYNKLFRPNRTAFDWLNRNKGEVDKYVDDEYCGGIFTAAYFKDFFRGLSAINHNFELVPKNLPILMISGSKDPVGGPVKLVTKLYEKYKKMEIKDLTFKLYPDARHEILLEENKEEVMTDCLNWLQDHLHKKRP
jgi:alpha-beta hydrolase superfamily lysophospholipase